MTELQELERAALVGAQSATLQVVSALRKYRQAVKQLLDSRYRDGEVDAVALVVLESEITAIEGCT